MYYHTGYTRHAVVWCIGLALGAAQLTAAEKHPGLYHKKANIEHEPIVQDSPQGKLPKVLHFKNAVANFHIQEAYTQWCNESRRGSDGKRENIINRVDVPGANLKNEAKSPDWKSVPSQIGLRLRWPEANITIERSGLSAAYTFKKFTHPRVYISCTLKAADIPEKICRLCEKDGPIVDSETHEVAWDEEDKDNYLRIFEIGVQSRLNAPTTLLAAWESTDGRWLDRVEQKADSQAFLSQTRSFPGWSRRTRKTARESGPLPLNHTAGFRYIAGYSKNSSEDLADIPGLIGIYGAQARMSGRGGNFAGYVNCGDPDRTEAYVAFGVTVAAAATLTYFTGGAAMAVWTKVYISTGGAALTAAVPLVGWNAQSSGIGFSLYKRLDVPGKSDAREVQHSSGKGGVNAHYDTMSSSDSANWHDSVLPRTDRSATAMVAASLFGQVGAPGLFTDAPPIKGAITIPAIDFNFDTGSVVFEEKR